MVTHDQEEAMAMADRLVLMKDGAVEQSGTQEDLYERPASPFVAGFIGRSNLVQAELADGGSAMADGARIQLAGCYAAGGPCTIALRPERLSIGSGTPGAGAVQGTVELSSYLGATGEHLVRIGPTQRLLVRDLTAGAARLRPPGETVTLTWDLGAERLFDGAGRAVEVRPA
jgi:putative spermidine/putrescine transport system ATP-binding protein